MIGLHKRAVLMIIPLFISLAGSYLYWLCDNENTETMILNTSIFGSLLSVPAILFYDWYTHRKLWKLPVWIISFAMFFLQGTSDRYAENIISIHLLLLLYPVYILFVENKNSFIFAFSIIYIIHLILLLINDINPNDFYIVEFGLILWFSFWFIIFIRYGQSIRENRSREVEV